MIAKKILGTVLAMSVVVSSAIGGGVDIFANSSAAFAEGENVDTLKAGTYTIPLIRQWSESKTGMQKNSPLHFYGQAILDVDSEGKKNLTIAVENWSLYDAFIPRKQGYFNEEYRYLPASVFNAESENDFTDFSYQKYENIIDSDDSKYITSTSENKYGNIIVDYETSKEIDVAYVTFEIEDYTSSFSFSAWLNTSFNGYNETADNAALTAYPRADYQWANITFHLDTNNIADVSPIVNNEADNDLSFFMSLASNRNKTGALSGRSTVNFTESAQAHAVFDSAVISRQDDKYVAKYHVNPDGYTTFVGKSGNYSDFKILKSVEHPILNADSNTQDDWDLLMTGTFTELYVDDDGYISITYDNINEALIGKYIFFDWGSTSNNSIMYCTPCLAIQKTEELTLRDEITDSGIYIVTDTSKYPKTARLKVEKNRDDIYYTTKVSDEDKNTIQAKVFLNERYAGSLYKDAAWYTLSIVDENGNTLNRENEPVDVYVPIKGKFSEVICNNNIPTDSNNSVWKLTSTDEYFHFVANTSDAFKINDMTISILEMNSYSNVHDITEDGLYSANAFFIKRFTEYTPSMANTGLVKKVYIEVKDGNKKMYFHSGPVVSGCYIGELFCNNVNRQDSDGIVNESTISYTDFEIAEGELVDNCVYNAYTEYANLKGGILTLDDNCYNSDNNYYSIAVVAPVMEGLTGTWIAKDKVIKDNTCVQLMFTDLKKCDDSVTLDKVLNEYGYGYQPSALLRKIRQSEIKYNIGKNTASDSTAFTEAYKMYSDPDAKSQDIEAAIKALDAVTTDVAPSAVIKGHDLTVNQWYELSYYVDLGYDVQNDKNAKVVFTLADGRTKTFDVTDDLFVAGQGYRFTLLLAAKQMSDKIHAKVVFSDGTEKDFSDEYSVKQYLSEYISTGDDDNLKAFAQATLNYGAYAQKYFDYNTDDLAAELADVSGITAEQIADPANAIPKNVGDEIEFAGAALTLEGETSIKLYFKLTGEFPDPDDHTIMYNNKKLKMQASNVSGVWYVTIPGIKAKQLGNVFKFTVDGTEYEYSPYTYMNKVLTNWEDTKYPYLHELLKALYAYSIAANNC